MCNRSITLDELVKDDFRIRITESNCTEEMAKSVYDSLQKRYDYGQDLTRVKIDQLFKAARSYRDVLSEEMEIEFHKKISDFILSNLDGSDNPYTMNLSRSDSPCDMDDVSSDISSDTLAEMFGSTLGVSSNGKTKYKYSFR